MPGVRFVLLAALDLSGTLHHPYRWVPLLVRAW
jgi:hypothetical protein